VNYGIEAILIESNDDSDIPTRGRDLVSASGSSGSYAAGTKKCVGDSCHNRQSREGDGAAVNVSDGDGSC
jgi:hypothetical protein